MGKDISLMLVNSTRAWPISTPYTSQSQGSFLESQNFLRIESFEKRQPSAQKKEKRKKEKKKSTKRVRAQSFGS